MVYIRALIDFMNVYICIFSRTSSFSVCNEPNVSDRLDNTNSSTSDQNVSYSVLETIKVKDKSIVMCFFKDSHTVAP